MLFLLSIFPALRNKFVKTPKNKSFTKKGPGRTHRQGRGF